MLQLADQLDQIAQMKDTATQAAWASAPIKGPPSLLTTGTTARFDYRSVRFQVCEEPLPYLVTNDPICMSA
jgi:hypothetical protein